MGDVCPKCEGSGVRTDQTGKPVFCCDGKGRTLADVEREARERLQDEGAQGGEDG